MPRTARVWISTHAHDLLNRELETLMFLFSAGAAREGDDDNATAIRHVWESRIQQIHDLLIDAVVGDRLPDCGAAVPGMVVTIRHDATGETDTFLLGVDDAEYPHVRVRSTRSPLGAAVAGAHVGQRRTYPTDSGFTTPITLLAAVPYGLHASTGAELFDAS